MDFSYSADQERVRRDVRDFVRAEVAPGAQERDESGKFDYALYKRLGDLGLIGMSLPEEYGGGGKDFLSYCLVLEEIARVDMALTWIMLVSMASAHSVISVGTDEQKKLWMDEWVNGIISGRTTASTGITEPDAGSDASRIQTTAKKEGGQLIINGAKSYITGAGLENNVGVLAVCLSGPTLRRYDTILVPKGTPGYHIGTAYKKMGLHCSDTRPLTFDNCRVPEISRVGDVGSGMRKTMHNLFIGRILLASTALGLAEECLSIATSYAKERFAFKRPVSEFQYIQGMLTEMALNVELGRNIRDKAIYLFNNDQPFFKEAAMAKWFICESAKKAADSAVQIFGGRGYMNDCPASRYYRDIRAATIAEGTTEIQRHVIAREMRLLSV